MKTSAFSYGVLAALVIALIGAFTTPLLVSALGLQEGARATVMLCVGIYCLIMLRREQVSVGAPTLLLAWVVASVACASLIDDFMLFAAGQAAFPWVFRSILIHRDAFRITADGVLSVAACAVAFLALSRTGSAFLTAWSFFLTQAFLGLLPLTPATTRRTRPSDRSLEFRRAQGLAEAALETLGDRRA